jgi:hypothetical protein
MEVEAVAVPHSSESIIYSYNSSHLFFPKTQPKFSTSLADEGLPSYQQKQRLIRVRANFIEFFAVTVCRS